MPVYFLFFFPLHWHDKMQPSAAAATASHLIRHNLRDFIRRSFPCCCCCVGAAPAARPHCSGAGIPIRWPTCCSCRELFTEDTFTQMGRRSSGNWACVAGQDAFAFCARYVKRNAAWLAGEGGRSSGRAGGVGRQRGEREGSRDRLARCRASAALSRFWDKLILWQLLSFVCTLFFFIFICFLLFF